MHEANDMEKTPKYKIDNIDGHTRYATPAYLALSHNMACAVHLWAFSGTHAPS
jgi:hypothetical protein